MTGHRPDQPGNQNPSDSASQSAGADVSADEFAAALKLIVKRLDGQDDEAETPPAGRDSGSDSAAVPPTAVLNSASQPTLNEPLSTGLSDSASGEPEAISPLAGGADAIPDATRDSNHSDAGTAAGTTTAADLWPASTADRSDSPMSGDEPALREDPLFTGTMAGEKEPLFSDSPADPGAGMEPPPVDAPTDSSGDNDAVHAPPPDTAGNDREPLFAESTPSEDPLFAASSPPPTSKEPLFAETPPSSGVEDPLFAQSPEPQPATEPLLVDTSSESAENAPFADSPELPAKEPLFVDTSTESAEDPLFAESPQPPAAKEPLFVDTSSDGAEDPLIAKSPRPAAKEPLFVDTPSDNGPDPLLAEKSPPTGQDPFKVESMISSGAYGQSDPSPPESDGPPSASDPLAALRNREDGPTIGPAMPGLEPKPEQGTIAAPEEPAPPAMDAAYGSDPTGSFSQSTSGLDYPEPDSGMAGAPEIAPVEEPASADPVVTPSDPFADAARPAFEDERASALFGDAPNLAEQLAPGSSLGPIGAEVENFEEARAAKQTDDALFGQAADGSNGNGTADLSASREIGDDADSDVELDQILPPLDPEAGTLEKVASPPGPRRSLRVGAAAFWMLVLAIFGGIGYWGFQTRHQTAALSAWAQDQYGLPGGQLAALLGQLSGSTDPVSPTVAPSEPSETPTALAALPPAAAPAAAPVVAQPAPAAALPAPAASPAPAPTTPAPVTVAAATPPRLPDHLAPLPSDVSPQIRALADRALAGDPLAQHDLANQYAVGESVPQSNSYAAYWYGLASEAGIANAQYNLGVLTTRGMGVRKDVQRAFQLFQGAAEAGHADAQTALGLAYMHGIGVQQDRLQAASWFQAASTNGRPRGAFHLGQLFEIGLDEAPDLAAAAGWYRIAADAGYVQAREALDRLTAAIRPAPAPTPTTRVAAPTTTPTPVPPSPAPILAQPSELVREIQQLLNQFGYNAGSQDGRLGQQTVEAIRAFQRSQGLYATGEASTGLRDLLKVLAGAG